MTNAEHAGRLFAEADRAMQRRRVLLCASTALATTRTVTAAAIRDGALAVLDALGEDQRERSATKVP